MIEIIRMPIEDEIYYEWIPDEGGARFGIGFDDDKLRWYWTFIGISLELEWGYLPDGLIKEIIATTKAKDI